MVEIDIFDTSNIIIISLFLTTGTDKTVICHQMNEERVQWHHATFGFPFASSLIEALNRDVHVPGLSFEMVRANEQIFLSKSIGCMIKK